MTRTYECKSIERRKTSARRNTKFFPCHRQYGGGDDGIFITTRFALGIILGTFSRELSEEGGGRVSARGLSLPEMNSHVDSTYCLQDLLFFSYCTEDSLMRKTCCKNLRVYESACVLSVTCSRGKSAKSAWHLTLRRCFPASLTMIVLIPYNVNLINNCLRILFRVFEVCFKTTQVTIVKVREIIDKSRILLVSNCWKTKREYTERIGYCKNIELVRWVLEL